MEIVVIAHNIRSVHNIGSIFRTSEGFGVSKIYLSGYSPSSDHGLPHVREKISRQLHKTALGAEKIVSHEYADSVEKLIISLKKSGFTIIGLEQDPRAIPLPKYHLRKGPTLTQKGEIVLLLGEEVHGITPELRDMCDALVEIPMRGQKESFNVAVAAGIALYHLTAAESAP
jgi:tRNA G18 (ribose-2'-O)-methylase SpoU